MDIDEVIRKVLEDDTDKYSLLPQKCLEDAIWKWGKATVLNHPQMDFKTMAQLIWLSLKRSREDLLEWTLRDDYIMSRINQMVSNFFAAGLRNNGKDLTKAKQLAEKAESLVKEAKLTEALEVLNQALLLCPQSDSEYIDYLNQRAYIFYQMDDLKNFLLDTGDALQNDNSKEFPKELYPKLVKSKPNNEPKVEDIVKVDDESEELPDASSDIRLSVHPKKGRIVVAKEDIAQNSLLLVNKPVVSVLSPTAYQTHCFNCFHKLSARFVPCSGCTTVRFCSEPCRVQSWNLGHKYECRYISQLSSLKSEYRGGMQLHWKYLGSPEQERVSDDLRLPIMSLDHNCETVTIGTAVKYLFLTSIYERVYPCNEGKQSLNGKMALAANLSKCCGKMFCNDFAVMDYELSKATNHEHNTNNNNNIIVENKSNREEIGTALYRTGSMFSHRCVRANADYRFYGNHQLVYSAFQIRQNEEVTIQYLNSTYMPLKERLRVIKKTRAIDCACQDCMSGYQTGYDLRCTEPGCDGQVWWYTWLLLAHCSTCGWKFGVKPRPKETRDKVQAAEESRAVLHYGRKEFEMTSNIYRNLFRRSRNGTTWDLMVAFKSLSRMVDIALEQNLEEGKKCVQKYQRTWRRLFARLNSLHLVVVKKDDLKAIENLKQVFDTESKDS